MLVSLALRSLGGVYCGGVVRRWLVLFSWLFCFVKWVIDLLLVLMFGGWVVVSCCAL